MKKFIILSLACLLTIIGLVSFGIFATIDGWPWYRFVMLIITTITCTSPLAEKWYNYFNNILNH